MSKHNNSASGGADELLTATFTGEHDVDVDNLFENSETVEWEFDERALFQTVAFRIYQSDEAGVREPLLNGISSALRAERLYDVDPKVGVYLYAGDDETPMTLVIRDNGVGVDEDTLRNGLAYVGKSQNRWVADLVGKFGVGFLASFRLVSETGMFFMHTHARETGEEFRGRWSSRGFEIDRGDDLPDVFGDDEYGTRLEFPIKDDISRASVREWVRKHAKNARVPVEYREEGFDETGGGYGFDPENKHEVYGGHDLTDKYSDTAPVLAIEEEEFVAYCSPDVDRGGQILCLDSPIHRGTDIRRRGGFTQTTAPFPIDLRLLSENGPVIEGPHEGLTPVKPSELREIPDEFHDQFMLESELTDADVRLPHPTGSRENLSDDVDAFLEYLHERFAEMYENRITDILDRVDDPDDVFDLPAQDRFLLTEMLDDLSRRLTGNDPQQLIQTEYGVELDTETVEMLELLTTTVKVVERGDDALADLDRTPYKVYQLAEVADDGTVYVGASLHPVKARIAWADDDANRVVELPSQSEFGAIESVTGMYDRLGDAFGWEPLKDISSATLDEFDAPDDLKDDLRNGVRTTEKGVESRELTLHVDNKEEKWNVTVGDLAEYLRAYHDEDTDLDADETKLTWEYDKPSRVIIFPSTGDANVSDHYDLSTKTTAVAYCTKKAAKHLDAVPGVIRFSEMEDVARERTVPTSDGELPVDGTPDKPIVHIVPDDQYDVFSDPDVMAAAAEYIPTTNKRQFRPADWSWGDDEDAVVDATYIPVTPEVFEQVSPALPDDAFVALGKNRHLSTRSNTDDFHTVNNTSIYGYAKLPEWRDTEMFANTMRNAASFESGGKEMVDALAHGHDNGFTLAAATDDETDSDTTDA